MLSDSGASLRPSSGYPRVPGASHAPSVTAAFPTEAPPAVPPPEGRAYAALDDAALMRLLVEQDVRALEVLYERYSRPLFSLGLKILGEREAVEEVVQEVFLRLWRRAARYDADRGRLLSWLLTITHHRAIDELRRRRNQHDTDNLEEHLIATGDSEDPSASLAHIEERAVLQEALATLPPAQSRPIQLAYYGGMTQVEIALALGAPLGTIKTRMRIGMQRLRAFLTAQAAEAAQKMAAGTGPTPAAMRPSAHAMSAI
jgi:RNA polymerase sigma-70 factor (ECF subfamily)